MIMTNWYQTEEYFFFRDEEEEEPVVAGTTTTVGVADAVGVDVATAAADADILDLFRSGGPSLSFSQFHQHFMRSFFDNITLLKNYTDKLWVALKNTFVWKWHT
jgi:hypothetical protein